MNFRQDINGLRAIAVIAVVLFHFSASLMPGGFAGVDVFFVISGFLMTGIIIRGIEQENFSIFKFYVARANRIIPALAVLCFVLLIFGWFYLSPFDYKELGKHAASSVGFISNVVYWKEAGYFDASSYEKWLLHTWSLSAEWQFYIIYPLVLVFLNRFIPVKNLKRLMVLGTIIGFIGCVYATLRWPDPAYYLLPTRAWEMMFGGLAFLYPLNSLKQHVKVIVERVGLLLIFISYILISKENAWPGYLALIPVLGAFLILVANRQDSKITNNIVFQYIGKWSYSIYLWHWPVVVFGYYFEMSNWVLIGLLISIILGFISFTFVERLRFKSFVSWLSFWKVKPFYMALFIGVFGYLIIMQAGYLGQLPKNIFKTLNVNIVNENKRTWELDRKLDKKENFITNDKKILIIGDSQSADFVNILAGSQAHNGIEISSKIIPWDCGIFYVDNNKIEDFLSPSINTAYKAGDSGTILCASKMKRAFDSQLVKQADYIFVAQQWRAETLPYIKPALTALSKRTRAKLILVGNKDILSKPSALIYYDAYASDKISQIDKFSESYINLKKVNLNESIKKIVNDSGAIFINMMDNVCTSDGCLVLSNNELAFYDKNHITNAGTKALSQKLNSTFLSIFDTP